MGPQFADDWYDDDDDDGVGEEVIKGWLLNGPQLAAKGGQLLINLPAL